VLTGWTCSGDFPLAGSPFGGAFNGPCDGFLAKLEADGSFAVFSSYVGGWRDDTAYALALDAAGLPLLVGETFSTNFPTTPGAFAPDHQSPDDWYDGFVMKLFPPLFCTSMADGGSTLHVDKAVDGGCAWVEPDGSAFDLVEGQLEQLGPDGLGDVTAVACGSFRFVHGHDTVPAPGAVLFHVARAPGGSYVDGALTGLVGDRTPGGGDCP
jgi:hypothetical protein